MVMITDENYMEQAITILVKDGMTRNEATLEFNERCAYHMRGYEATPRNYAEQIVLAEIIEWSEDEAV